jgi:hypothetical protein
MQYVKVTKIALADNPEYPTCKQEDYEVGKINKFSPFVGYTLEGYLLEEIQVGKTIKIDRQVRNGVKMQGYFHSSLVTAFDGKIAETLNSKYLIEPLNGLSLPDSHA